MSCSHDASEGTPSRGFGNIEEQKTFVDFFFFFCFQKRRDDAAIVRTVRGLLFNFLKLKRKHMNMINIGATMSHFAEDVSRRRYASLKETRSGS